MGNILDIIVENGLSVRYVPLITHETLSMHFHEEGNEIIKTLLSNIPNYEVFKEKRLSETNGNGFPSYEFNDKEKIVYRLFTKRKLPTPKGGYWLCQQIKHTSSMYQWSTKTDNKADSLEESVLLFMQSKKV